MTFQVNGTSVNGMDHQSVVGLLKEAGTSVCLVVSREVIPVTDNEVSHRRFLTVFIAVEITPDGGAEFAGPENGGPKQNKD